MSRPRWLKRLVCRLIGHDLNPMDPYDCQCYRCGLTWDHYGSPPLDDLWFWLRWYDWRARLRLREFRHWLRCPDCRVRFGKHDPDRCLPF